MSRIFTLAVALLLLHLSAGRSATFVVTSAADSHDAIPGDGICGDPALPDSVRCTFRAAIEEANALSDRDTIHFASGLPAISLYLGTVTVSRNGTVIDGAGADPILDGLDDPFFSSLIVLSSDSNVIRGLTIRRSRYHSLVVRGSENCIGDSTSQTQTIFVSSGIDRTSSAAIYLTGDRAFHNTIVGCRIGLGPHGEPLPNQNGIILDSSATDNTVGGSTTAGRNHIAGNHGYGVILSNAAKLNLVRNCFIGTDISGLMDYGNDSGGVLLDSRATQNRIGGNAIAARNFISWNRGPGVSLRGTGTSLNTIAGNLIGLDYSGEIGIPNALGILVSDAAPSNIIGGFTSADRNIITGNDGDGIRIVGAGTFDNRILGNFIGTDTSGYYDIGNGWTAGHGIFIGDGAGRTVIGGNAGLGGNVISGNPHAGICLSGSSRNSILGNLIGVSIGSVSSCPNGNGVLLENGASENTIGGAVPGDGNTISGNRAELFPNGAGVAIFDPGSEYNRVVGNMIGTDSTGSRSLRNGSCGVIIGHGARHNQIGGANAGERNIISGNGAGSISINLGAGVHLFGEGTADNQVCGNYIGVSANGVTPILNLGNGIGIYNGAAHNMIGGLTSAEGNLVARSPLNGIFEAGPGTMSNSFLNNLIYDNDSLGISIRDNGNLVPAPPLLTDATESIVGGSQAPPLGRVQVYKAAADPSGYGEGKSLVGEGLADSTGAFTIAVANLVPGDSVTAIVTDTSGSSSEFALNREIDAPTAANEHESRIPREFALEPNFPNPFNPSTQIRFSLPKTNHVILEIINLQGEYVTTLLDCVVPAGAYTATWDGRSRSGSRVASGIYLYRLQTDDFTASRKMILLK